jgi:RHS repeat-associated protein
VFRVNGVTLSDGWIKATIRTKSWSGHSHNGEIAFGYADMANYLYAGLLDGSNKWRIARRSGDVETTLASLSESIATDTPYEVEVIVCDGQVTMAVNGQHRVLADLGGPASGPVGLRASNAHSHFDNVVIAPMTPLTTTVETFGGDLDGWTAAGGDWLAIGDGVSGQQEDTLPGDVWGLLLAPDGLTSGRMEAVVTTQSWADHSYNGGFVFDYQDAANFRWARMLEGVNRWVIGETVAGTNAELATFSEDIQTGVPYTMTLVLEGGRATLLANGVAKVSYDFGVPFGSATVGLGVQHAHTHFVQVTLTPWETENVHRDDAFDRWEPAGWETLAGTWWSDGEMHGAAGGGPALAARNVVWSGEGVITATVTAPTGGAARVVFGLQSAHTYRYAELAAGVGWRIGQVVNGTDTVLAQGAGAPVAGQPYLVRVEVTGGLVRLYVDGGLKASYDFGQGAPGWVGLGATGGEARFDDLAVEAVIPAETRSYYYAGAQRVAMRQNGVLTYLHGDHLGSTSLTTNEAGRLVARVLYYPYGETRWMTGTLTTDFTFTGQRAEGPGLGGLMDYGARFYDVALGRFISADTIVPGAEKSQAYNRYMYVEGNPCKYTDPTGHGGGTECSKVCWRSADGKITNCWWECSEGQKCPPGESGCEWRLAGPELSGGVVIPGLLDSDLSYLQSDDRTAVSISSFELEGSGDSALRLKGARVEGTYWILPPLVGLDGNFDLLGDFEHSRIQLTLGAQVGLGAGGSANAGPLFTNADLEEYGSIVNHAGFTLSDDAFLGSLTGEIGGIGALFGLDIDYGWADGEGPQNLFVGVIGGGEEASAWYGRSLFDAGLMLDTGELEGQLLFWPFQVDLWE